MQKNQINKYIFLVQASSTSWSGGPDDCLNNLHGKTILQHTVDKVLADLYDYVKKLVIIAPEFDKGGLDIFVEQHPLLSVSYGFDESPLMRMVTATHDLTDEDIFCRINALNFCFDSSAAVNNLQTAEIKSIDCIKFPDDFPALFTSDIYKVGALRRIAATENLNLKYHIHPKYYMETTDGFTLNTYKPNMDLYSDSFLMSIRSKCIESTNAKRIPIVESKVVQSGCTITHHYQIALDYIQSDMKVLDLACGNGFGTRILAGKASEVYGLDNDNEIILKAQNDEGRIPNSRFILGDVLNIPFEGESFDCVVAFEILEHVDPDTLLEEITRILKKDALAIISTPQNSLGHIPLTPAHIQEFSGATLREIISKYLSIVDFIGIKQGAISIKGQGEEIGSNSFVICKKPQQSL